jgi:hypothetical protein
LRYPISVPSRSARRKPRGRELGPCRSTTPRICSFGRPKRPLEAYPHASTRAHRVAERQRKQPRGAFSSYADPSLNVKRRPRDQHVPAPEAREIRLAGAYTRRPDPISVVDEPGRERGWFTYGRRESNANIQRLPRQPTHIFPLLPPTRYRAPLRTVTHAEPSR